MCGEVVRNVYGYNILNAKHLELAVGRQKLREWIADADYRGRIEPLDDGLFLWTFREGDDQEAFLYWRYPPVVRVREELMKHHLFPWQRLLEE